MPSNEIEYPALVMPETVERKTVKIWSNGVALDADLYRLKGLAEEQRVPAVVLSHGWGGSSRRRCATARSTVRRLTATPCTRSSS